jgi:hypothetical protein
VSEDQIRQTIDHAMIWLRHHYDSTAAHVLRVLLDRSDLAAHQARQTIDHATNWVAEHGDDPARSHVLRLLLERSDLDNEKRGLLELIVRHSPEASTNPERFKY